VLLEDSVCISVLFSTLDMTLQYASGPKALEFSLKEKLEILKSANTP